MDQSKYKFSEMECSYEKENNFYKKNTKKNLMNKLNNHKLISLTKIPKLEDNIVKSPIPSQIETLTNFNKKKSDFLHKTEFQLKSQKNFFSKNRISFYNRTFLQLNEIPEKESKINNLGLSIVNENYSTSKLPFHKKEQSKKLSKQKIAKYKKSNKFSSSIDKKFAERGNNMIKISNNKDTCNISEIKTKQNILNKEVWKQAKLQLRKKRNSLEKSYRKRDSIKGRGKIMFPKIQQENIVSLMNSEYYK